MEDPSCHTVHTLKMKPKTVSQARRNMIKYLKNQGNYKISDFKGMSYNEIRPIFEKEDVDYTQKMKEVVKEPGAKRKKSIPRKSTRKRQKMEEDAEKEDSKFLEHSNQRVRVPPRDKKKIPLSQEMISKMLKKKLEVDHESSQAFELLRFIRSQVQK
ncbi:hypothetical protein Tco_0448536 [Tanacetum coccineum]